MVRKQKPNLERWRNREVKEHIKNSVPTAKKTQNTSIAESNLSVAIYENNRYSFRETRELINALCNQNTESLNVKGYGTYIYHVL
jgi:hypothetical protein